MKNNNTVADERATIEAAAGCCWPVNWSGVFVGGLAALAMALLTGLIAIAVGAQIVGRGEYVANWDDVRFGGIVATVLGAFFSYVVGGWVAGKITGYTLPENTMLHGAIAWLITIPVILLFAALGAGGYFGGWYSGLAGTPVWSTAAANLPEAEAAAIVRNNALGAITALLLGLMGSVIGGWMASGEAMTLRWTTNRSEEYASRSAQRSREKAAHAS